MVTVINHIGIKYNIHFIEPVKSISGKVITRILIEKFGICYEYSFVSSDIVKMTVEEAIAYHEAYQEKIFLENQEIDDEY